MAQAEASTAADETRTPEAVFRHLREAGRTTAVDVASNEAIEKPAWFDEERFRRAWLSVDKFRLGIQYSSFTGLLMILQLPDGLEPLLSTGNSKDVPSLFQRYLATVVHVNNWYEDDVFDPNTKGYKSIRQVRLMHKRVQANMNDKFAAQGADGSKRVWFSEFDVAMTQFAFIGLAILYPRKSGLVLATDTELEDVNYYWRVLGYLMGMRDEFNLCQFDSYAQIRDLYALVMEHEYKEVFAREPCPCGLQMSKSICIAMEDFVPLVTFNSLAHWWQEEFSFNQYQLEPLSFKEKIFLAWQRLAFNKLMNNETFLRFSNKLQKMRFQSRLKNKEKIYKRLKDKYEQDKGRVYLSERHDYGVKLAEPKPAEPKSGCPFGFGRSPAPVEVSA